MIYRQALQYVSNLGEFSYDFNLSRIEKFLEKIGNPQNRLKIVHVAGTNGKGSVCAYISSILQESGYKVGLYTSPHLIDIRERIKINRNYISANDFTKFTCNYSPLSIIHSLTYFEFLTAMAFWYFEKEKVDFAIIEVGLGGRLDATNIIKKPLLSIITNISLEHTQYLGNTIKKISKEKAGIIKNSGAVVTGATGIALKTINNIAKFKNSKVYSVKSIKKYELPLLGNHQQKNAAIAVKCSQLLNVPEIKIIEGLKKTHLRGRFEIKQFKTTRNAVLPPVARLANRRGHSVGPRHSFKIVLDVAHNPAGMLVLKNSINKYFGSKINFVFGVLKDKNYKQMIANISSVIKNVFISAPKIKRALKPEIAYAEFKKYLDKKNIFMFKDIKSAAKTAINNSEDFCLTGSFYTVSEGIKCLKIW